MNKALILMSLFSWMISSTAMTVQEAERILEEDPYNLQAFTVIADAAREERRKNEPTDRERLNFMKMLHKYCEPPALNSFTNNFSGFSSNFGSCDVSHRYYPSHGTSLSSDELLKQIIDSFVKEGWVEEKREKAKSNRFIFIKTEGPENKNLCVPKMVILTNHLHAEKGFIRCDYYFRCEGGWASKGDLMRKDILSMEPNDESGNE
ncbi:hypothetical protein P4C99_06910 [Pontiellaceae bacterium B1224]|nr:hypothetical protein [Pontiellaceae bacterium B1224]